MDVRVRNLPRPKPIPQSAEERRSRTRADRGSLPAEWGVVLEERYSEDNTVDVLLRTGLVLRRVGVLSRKWAGYNDDTGFGEQDLPPVDSEVLVLFPSNLIEEAFIIGSRLEILGDAGSKQESAGLLGAGQEDKRTAVSEVGWTETYDKESGDYALESPSGDTNQIVVKYNRTAEEIELTVGPNTFKVKKDKTEMSGGQGISMSANGATIEITSTGAVNVSPAAGMSLTLAGGAISCNNFPNCLFTGAPHSTALFVKV